MMRMPIKWQMQRVGAHLCEHRLVALSGTCRADKHIKDPVSIEANARLFLQSARTALYERCKSDAVAAIFDHAPLQGLLLGPPDLPQRCSNTVPKSPESNCAGGS